METHQKQRRDYWLKRARGLARRINFGWWLAAFLPILLIITLIFSCLILYLRGFKVELSLYWIAYFVALLLSGLVAYFLVRKRLFTTQAALTHIENKLVLYNQLSTAFEGVGPWPKELEVSASLARWRPARVYGPVVAALFFLLAANQIPVSRAYTPNAEVPVSEPLAWTEVESWIEMLEQEEMAAPEAIEELRKQLDELRTQDPDEWFDHGSLEAGDSLRDETRAALEEFRKNLTGVEQELLALKKQFEAEQEDYNLPEFDQEKAEPAKPFYQFPEPSEELKQKLDQLQKQLEKFNKGMLPLDPQTMQKLDELDVPSRMITPEELEELLKRLEQMQEQMDQGFQEGKPEELLIVPMPGGGGDRDNKGSSGDPGSGGISRGPGTAPLSMSEQKSPNASRRVEGAQNKDLSRAGLGETVGVTKGEHGVDPGQYSTSTGGGVRSAGEGGRRVFKEQYKPGETEVLKRYFK